MEIKFLQMKRALRSVLLVLLLTVVGMTNAKAQTPYRQYADNGVLLDFHEIDNVDFSYLHLIDNLTGNDVDLLAVPSYMFEARDSDDTSRFRIVYKMK